MIRNRSTVPVIEWASNHFSWPLVDSPELSVKFEEIPAGGKSELHYHNRSRQFFFILKGESVVKIENHSFLLKKYDGIEIPHRKKHQIENKGSGSLLFILISYPRVQEDDIYLVDKESDERIKKLRL